MKKEHHLTPEDSFWKRYFFRMINRSDTRLGRFFDVTLLFFMYCPEIIDTFFS